MDRGMNGGRETFRRMTQYGLLTIWIGYVTMFGSLDDCSSQRRPLPVSILPVPLPENVYENSGAYAGHTQYFQHPTRFLPIS